MSPSAASANQTDVPRMLRLAAAGDADAWSAIVVEYTGRVYGLLLRQCGDRELAEELTQDTFVKVVTKLGDAEGYEERGRFESWLFRIASNRLRDEMRRRKRQARPIGGAGSDRADAAGAGSGGGGGGGWAAVEGAITRDAGRTAPDRGDDPLEAITRAEQVALMQAAVAQMSAADQEILHLRHTAGLSFAQIAESLDQPLGTVLARGHRALKKLRAALEQVGVEAL